MKTIRYKRTALMMLIVFSFAAGQNPQPTSLPVGSATVAELKGAVSFRSPQGSDLTGQRGMVLDPDSVIETVKGSVLLDLQDGSQVLVKPHSRVVLRAPSEGKGYWLELLIGKIFAKVQKRLGSTPSFRMGTPTAVITVRGTRFSVEVTKKNRTVVDVFEGLVEVAGLAEGSRPVLIRPGFGTRVEQDRAPEEPREMENPGEGMGPGSAREDDRSSQPGWGTEGGRDEQSRPTSQGPSQPERDR